LERATLPPGHEGRPDERLWSRLRTSEARADAHALEGNLESVYKAEQEPFHSALSDIARKEVGCEYLLATWTAAYLVEAVVSATGHAREVSIMVSERWLKRKVASAPEDGLLDAAEVNS
jgi:hypothetical protein